MNCPECNAEISWSEEELADGEILTCEDCDSALEVVHLEGGGIGIILAEDFELGFEDDIEW